MKPKLLTCGLSLPAASTLFSAVPRAHAADPAIGKKPNIVVIWGDDVGQSDVSAYSMGLMGFKTPNIDRVATEGVIFTDIYAEQSCTAGRSSFITGQLLGVPPEILTVGSHRPRITRVSHLK
jgi:arylsulfatase